MFMCGGAGGDERQESEGRNKEEKVGMKVGAVRFHACLHLVGAFHTYKETSI